MALYRKRKAASSSCGKFPEYGTIFMCSTGTKEEYQTTENGAAKTTAGKKAKKSQSRPSKNRASLAISSGGLLPVSESKQVAVNEQVECVDVATTYYMVLEDYIPLSSPDCGDIEINIKPKSSIKNLNSDASEQRMSVFACLDLSLQSAGPSRKHNSMALEGFSRQFTNSDLLPCFVHQPEKKTCEADHPVKKILETLEERQDNWKISRLSVSRVENDGIV